MRITQGEKEALNGHTSGRPAKDLHVYFQGEGRFLLLNFWTRNVVSVQFRHRAGGAPGYSMQKTRWLCTKIYFRRVLTHSVHCRPSINNMPAIDNIPEAERWSDASQATRKQAKKSFALPKDVKIILLPSRDTSISEMLLFSTPPHSRRKNNLDPALFFSTEPAQEVDEAELTQLRSLPIPPSTVVRQLDAVSRQQWMDGAKSMSYAHIDGQTRHHPIWLISYWMTVTTLRDTVWKLWQDIDTWLQKNQLQHKIIDRREHAVLTRALLAEVPWSLSKSGMTDKQPMHSLWRLFGESWTNSTVQDNMLDMLRVRATSDPSLADRFIVGHVDLTTKIVEASGHGIGTWKIHCGRGCTT